MNFKILNFKLEICIYATENCQANSFLPKGLVSKLKFKVHFRKQTKGKEFCRIIFL
ncbi:hypothetical protein P872_10225 [Rhodonellum psychrophilum GCM71 = DSM 17998]|uniref:Uncharacterized protein n=1 Tax=Rhodonellum psychrophilum GCM71 = DSM 17998 TaxID=1123057 RepID=U5C005_9BACT|nr:hypothetical protein P872_10225 [Rhodonellum psychrophilum GCM71 = DSM 17998]